jgi:hypothetical protein
MICLRKMIESAVTSSDEFTECWDEIWPTVASCLDEDWDLSVRFVSWHVIEALLRNFGHALELRYFEFYTEMLKRMDDSQDMIRIEICRSFITLFELLNENKFGINYKYIVNALFIHLDDNSEEIRAKVSEVLLRAIPYEPE